MTGTAVATPTGGVPALIGTPASEFTSEDIALANIKLGQFSSEYVKHHDVPDGCIFAAVGKDDADPQVLWAKEGDNPVRFYPLSLRKGKSLSEDGELTLYDYDDPEAPAAAWTTYTYTVAVPAFDQSLPLKFLLTRSGKPSAQQINTVIAKHASVGPAHELCFELTCAMRNSTKGDYFVPRVRHVDADKKELAVVETLLNMVSTPEPTMTVERPAI